MAPFLPVILSGHNLGIRHHQFNSLVNDAYEQKIPFSSIQYLEEHSPLDRLFKIELASRYKNEEYIVENLQNEDMLYVSKALKSKWLVDAEYSHIFNIAHLENELYPQMTTTAVARVKHWLCLNLKDSQRSQEFYQYYKVKDFNTAIKFLRNCSNEFILSEAPNILENLTPKRLKVLSEKCPEVAKTFFDSLENNNKVIENYNKNIREYYNSMKFLLKVSGDIFLDIVEKYGGFSRFSAEATEFIMENFKQRFDKKTELYVHSFLDIKTIATCLSSEEIKEVVLKLARAQYIQDWFTYKNLEPLIKVLKVEERKTFNKKVFVDKDVGEMVQTWPYDRPCSPHRKARDRSFFHDAEYNSSLYETLCVDMPRMMPCNFAKGGYAPPRMGIQRKCHRFIAGGDMVEMKSKSTFDQLFDTYRFVSFGAALHELRKRMKAESNQDRQNVMLLLISKTGGRAKYVEELLTLFATQYQNEPDNLRATIIRSLVRRSFAWRLPQNVWELMLKFGHGLGLDGQPSTVACREGLHAVILRSILLDWNIEELVWKGFLGQFSDLKEYSLNVAEKKKVITKLPELLLDSAMNDATQVIELIDKTLDVLDAYKVRADACPGLISAIAMAAKNTSNAERLLRRLYNSRIARKQLFRDNFKIFQSDESYLNALKHDIDIISSGETFEELIKSNKIDHDRFLRALTLYFNEEDGLGQKYLSLLKTNAEKSPKMNLARSVALLSGNKLLDMILEYDAAPKKSERKRFASALIANMHLVRPLPELEALDWKLLGAKAVGNRVLICSANNIDRNIKTLLAWSRTQRLALVLSIRAGKEMDALTGIGDRKPKMIVKTIFLHSKAKKLDERVWDIIIPAIQKIGETGKLERRIQRTLYNVEIVAESKKVKYCETVYKVLQKHAPMRYAAIPMLCHLENMLDVVDEELIENVIREFLNDDVVVAVCKKKIDAHSSIDILQMLYNNSFKLSTSLRIRIIAKYLLLCKNEAEQQQRWEQIGKPVLDFCGALKHPFEFNDFIKSLKYTKAFLNTKYVSCLPMIENVINKLQTFLPLHLFYNKYIYLHLTMLYFKTLRQAKKNNPLLFEDLPKSDEAATELVGRIFGKYIAHEVTELMDTHFESIREIYKKEVVEYILTGTTDSVT